MDESAGLKLALDLARLEFALFASPIKIQVSDFAQISSIISSDIVSPALMSEPFFKANRSTLGTLKDEVNAMVSNGSTIATQTTIE